MLVWDAYFLMLLLCVLPPTYVICIQGGWISLHLCLFVCGASIGWVTMSLSETLWCRNIEGENVNTNFSPVSFVL